MDNDNLSLKDGYFLTHSYLEAISKIVDHSFRLVRLWRIKPPSLEKLRRARQDLLDIFGEILSAADGLSFATFFWKVAQKTNPNNPVNPV